MSNASIFLIGPMGSGKSAVGRRLAMELGREFIDSDEGREAVHGGVHGVFGTEDVGGIA